MSTLRSGVPAPISPVAVLPLRSGVLFPGATLTFAVGRPRSVALLRNLYPGDIVVTFSQRDPRTLDLGSEDLHPYGTYARVKSVARRGEREFELSLEGLDRARFESFTSADPFYKAEVTLLEETNGDTPEAHELARALKLEVEGLVRDAGGALAQIELDESDASGFADRIAALLDLPAPQEIEILGEPDVPSRIRLLVKRIGEAKAQAEVRSKIETEVRKELGKNQREHVLREQMRAIKKELGEGGGDDELANLRQRLDEANLPDDARKVADRELRRLESMGGQGAETHVIRNYLELIADLPWSKRASEKIDLDKIAEQLNEDHYGLEDIKKRILEHVAVLKLSNDRAEESAKDLGKKEEPRLTGTLLCFVGPPGVGKTSLGQSIADATGRPFVRVALGGVRDEAEIRGHRRTYVGALPGRILHALRKAGVKNPVVLLDEVDKMTAGWAGSPEAALLEVLDPEQNRTFTDHYLELPFDLSEVMFICTANTLETLSAPLRDRLEIVELTGYTPDEKVHIARKHLVAKRTKDHGIAEDQLVITDEAIERIVRDYTREAGVRQLDREIKKVCRAAALEVARRSKKSETPLSIGPEDLVKHLGKPKFESEVAERTSIAGVVTGLAWTPFGGSILFVETSRMPGRGSVEITGQLGDVMKESARAALTYVRSNASQLGIRPEVVEGQDVHIHVPAGAVPKDGPSAGVTIFTALVSLFTGRRIKPDTAMTGEATLRGRVLPVGGIKAKVLAAHRAGIKRVILPAKVARDLDDVPAEVREQLEFILVEDMKQVIEAALEKEPSELPTVFGGTSRKDSPAAHA
ncbi:ATP-dependent protease La [Labilithrix luteola]|uniref:Lon protease n=1 Tax=Labilithrix luteola TaxID=1391654 RepID=A0A0K1Q5S8_9BACT|nr:endopeptidase La [Labilithrix luteola]AKV01017.1 ATP-dependent protease La [Labilithrix luteola]